MYNELNVIKWVKLDTLINPIKSPRKEFFVLKKLSLLLALIIAFSAIFVPASVAAAPVQVNATVIINNNTFVPPLPLLNIDDRLIAPFRAFGEAMGAEVVWEESNRRITTLFGNRYSIMHLDNPIVTYGTFTRTAQNQVQFNDSRTQVLEVAPRLVGNNTYIPIRAFAEIVGVDVNWVAHTSTAFITAVPPADTEPPPNNQPPANQPPANNDRPANFGDFSNTSYFRLRTSSAVRNMHQDANNNPFIFVLYDSSLDSSKAIVPNIQDLAQELRFRVYGVDMADTNNRAADNNWLWNTFREPQFVDPTVYFVRDRNSITQVQAPTDMDQLRDRIERFRTEAETGIEFGDFRNTTYFQNRTDRQIQSMIDNNDEFILVLYDSAERDSAHYVPIIKAAAEYREFRVYALDIDRNPNFHRNVAWLSEFDRADDLPTMILIYRERNRMRDRSQPDSVSRAVGYINEFIRDSDTTTAGSQFNDITRTNNAFRNYDIINLRNRYQNNDSAFVILLYNSYNGNYQDMLNDFADEVTRMSLPSWMNRVYAVNQSSNTYSRNHIRSNYDWLNISNARYHRTSPLLIFVPPGVNIDVQNSVHWHDPNNVTAVNFAVWLTNQINDHSN